MPARQIWEVTRRVEQIVAKPRGDLTRRLAPQPEGAALLAARGKAFGGSDVRGHEFDDAGAPGGEQRGQFAEAGFEPVDKAPQLEFLALDGIAQPDKPRRGSWPGWATAALQAQSA